MTVSYIRPDKIFDGAYEQLKLVNAYIEQQGITVDREFIDQVSQNKRLSERDEVVSLFRPLRDGVVIVYDVWVLSSVIEDLVQMLSCLLKNGMQVHFVKPSVVIDRDSDTMVVLGLIDQLRQTLQQDEKKAIGRPKGSRSASKFDQYHDDIIEYLRARKSVSEMARIFGVSRSSLKDYIESRELKEVAFGGYRMDVPVNGAANVIETIKCPDGGEESEKESV
ncbi:MAG: recombinase family protein [Sulfurimonadaceae bacterium]|nr:recombinase family protein [Sulfurimonadaceae bacterium]